MKFYRQTYRQVPVHDTPLLGVLPLAPKLLVLYCAKHCARDGSIPIRSAAHVGASLRHRFGGDPREVSAIDRAVRIARECNAVQVSDTRLVVVEFPLWQRRTFDTWRRLYVHEEVAFGKLPVFARALAAELMRLCNDEGVIALDVPGLVEHLASREATKSERRTARRLVERWVADLIGEGYLVGAGRHLAVKNFRIAQGFETAAEGAKVTDPAPVGSAKVTDPAPVGSVKVTDLAPVGGVKVTDLAPVGGAKVTEPAPGGVIETEISGRIRSIHDPVFIPSSIHPSSVWATSAGGSAAALTTPSAEPQAQASASETTAQVATPAEPEPFRLTSPPPAQPKRSKKTPRVDTLPLAPCVPDPGTAARIVYDAVKSEPVFATMHRPGENCLRWVQMFGVSLGAERMRRAVHSAAQYLTSAKVERRTRGYTDLAKFMLNQFEMILDREGPSAPGPVAQTPGTLSVFADAPPTPRGVVAVG